MGGKLSKQLMNRSVRSADARRLNGSGQAASSSITDCFKTKKKRGVMMNLKIPEMSETTASSKKLLTLEDWLLASPAPAPANAGPNNSNVRSNTSGYSGSGGEYYVFKQSSSSSSSRSKRVHPSFAAASSSSIVSSRHSISQVMKKKVSFRLPQESDVIVFYSPPHTVNATD